MSKESDFIDIMHKEMEDLKNGLQTNYSRHLERENAKLKQQLAEKDKKQSVKLRHEICEKIRNEIKQLIENKDNSLTNWEYANGWCSALQYNMAEILQKIEKGEE